MHICALMTSFNRKRFTVRSIAAILGSAVHASVELSVCLMDDGSTDGTAAEVGRLFPKVKVLNGDGTLYWNGGMRRAWEGAVGLDVDFFLWLNDDLIVLPGALQSAIATYVRVAQRYGPKILVVGRTIDPITKMQTYGGLCQAPGMSRLRFVRAVGECHDCTTMNGNFVLIPSSAVSEVGMNSRAFRHSAGDMDYGLRARKKGFRIVQMEEHVGLQAYNENFARSTKILTSENWRHILFHPKGVPVREWFLFCLYHGGPLGIANFIVRYWKMIRASAWERAE
jgi:GT2 family glycosyltransferase